MADAQQNWDNRKIGLPYNIETRVGFYTCNLFDYPLGQRNSV